MSLSLTFLMRRYTITEIDFDNKSVKLKYKTKSGLQMPSAYNPWFKHLKELMVEYDGQTYCDGAGRLLSPQPWPIINQLPIPYHEWDEILSKYSIDSEIDFSTITQTDIVNDEYCRTTFAQVTIPEPEPKTYTEEEVQSKIQKFCDDHPLQRGVQVIGNTVKDWWINNK